MTRMNADSRTRVFSDMVIGIDPAGSTVEIQINGQWYPATWQGTAVKTSVKVGAVMVDKWTQVALSDDYFAGPSATPAGATVLPIGQYPTKTRVTKGGDILAADSGRIDVR